MPLLRIAAVPGPYVPTKQTPSRAPDRLPGYNYAHSPEHKGAVRAGNVVVRAVPLIVRRAYDTLANQHTSDVREPECHCTPATRPEWEPAAAVCLQGHLCLLHVCNPPSQHTPFTLFQRSIPLVCHCQPLHSCRRPECPTLALSCSLLCPPSLIVF